MHHSIGSGHPGVLSALALLCVAGSGLAFPAAVCAADAPAKAPPCRVAVDPRVELMCIVFRLAGNPEYNRGQVRAYTDDVTKQFGPFKDHAAVSLARRLRSTRGVSFDACMGMAVHLPDVGKLADPGKIKAETFLAPRPEGLDGRWTVEHGREFLVAAGQFVKDASFQEFVKSHRPLYEVTESRLRAFLEKQAHLEWFNRFFGDRPAATFVVVPGLLNGPGNYGVRCRTADGKEDLYCILGVWHTDEGGMPEFDPGMVGTVVHEFCHSYANAVIDRHAAELQAAGERIFPHVASKMASQAYGNWKTMLYESLVRACVLRYKRHYDGAAAAWLAVRGEKARGFVWIEELSDLLGEYEKHRDQYPALEAFSPRLVAFFNDYAGKFAPEQAALGAKRPKVVSMVPANGATDVDPGLGAIVVVFDRPMQDGCWSMCGGGPHFPEIVGKPSYDAKRTTWTVRVKLKPDWSYQFMLNSPRFNAFQSTEGVPLEPVEATFKTAKGK